MYNPTLQTAFAISLRESISSAGQLFLSTEYYTPLLE